MATGNLPSREQFLAEGIKPDHCVICLEVFTAEHPPVRVIGCDHVFGKDCLNKSVLADSPNANKCPCCRRVLYQEIQTELEEDEESESEGESSGEDESESESSDSDTSSYVRLEHLTSMETAEEFMGDLGDKLEDHAEDGWPRTKPRMRRLVKEACHPWGIDFDTDYSDAFWHNIGSVMRKMFAEIDANGGRLIDGGEAWVDRMAERVGWSLQ